MVGVDGHGTAGGTATTLPLRTVRYLPDVDKWNAVQRKPVLVVPFTFDGPAGRGGYRLVVALPNGAKAVSLRATATDVQGNSIEQTVLRAFSISD